MSRLTAMAPASFFSTLPVPSTPSTNIDILCTVCLSMLDRPIELGCGNMVCLLCCTRWLTISDSVDCPCCYSPLQNHTHSPSRVTMAVLGGQLVACTRGCNRTVQAEHYQQHIQSQCQAFFQHSTHSPSRITIQDILDKERDCPTTPAERHVAKHLIKRLMAEGGDDKILQLPTRGQVYMCVNVL